MKRHFADVSLHAIYHKNEHIHPEISHSNDKSYTTCCLYIHNLFNSTNKQIKLQAKTKYR